MALAITGGLAPLLADRRDAARDVQSVGESEAHFPDCPVSRDVVPARALFGHGHAPDRCAGLEELGVRWSSPRIPKGPDRPAGYVSRDLVFPMLLEPLKVPSRWATVEAPRVLARVGRPESRLTLRVSARTPRRKACSQWRTWKCRLMHRRDDPDHAERPRAPLGGNRHWRGRGLQRHDPNRSVRSCLRSALPRPPG